MTTSNSTSQSQSKEHVVAEVSHWIHDEQSCVTVQRIVQTFHVSWSDGLALLQEIPKSGNHYTITRYDCLEDTNSTSTSNSKCWCVCVDVFWFGFGRV